MGYFFVLKGALVSKTSFENHLKWKNEVGNKICRASRSKEWNNNNNKTRWNIFVSRRRQKCSFSSCLEFPHTNAIQCCNICMRTHINVVCMIFIVFLQPTYVSCLSFVFVFGRQKENLFFISKHTVWKDHKTNKKYNEQKNIPMLKVLMVKNWNLTSSRFRLYRYLCWYQFVFGKMQFFSKNKFYNKTSRILNLTIKTV